MMTSSDALDDSRTWRLANADLSEFLNPQLFRFFVRFCFIGIVFSNTIDVSRTTQSGDTVQLNFQILLKLGLVLASCALGLWGLATNPQTRRLMNSLPGLLVLGLIFWHFATIPTAVKPTVAIASALAFFGIVSLTLTAIALLGAQRVIFDACCGLAMYVVASLLLYVVSPELAVFQEYIGPTETVARLGGLGHPNSLGRAAILVALMAYASASMGSLTWKWVFLAIVVSVVVMLTALSRTPILAGFAGLAIVLLPPGRPSTYMILAVALVIGMCGWFAAEATIGSDRLLDRVLVSTTKTGDKKEVLSLTGRTQIWQNAKQMILQRPIFGWGSGSANVTMGTMSGHAHNILLQPTVALGVPGGVLVLALLIWNLYCLIRYPNVIFHAFMVFIFVLGLVETPLLGPFPDAMTLMWIAACFWPIEI